MTIEQNLEPLSLKCQKRKVNVKPGSNIFGAQIILQQNYDMGITDMIN